VDDVLRKLAGGDRRSVGRVDEVIADVLSDPTLFRAVFDGMLSDDPIIKMRSADAIEKITAERPEYLQPYKDSLLYQVAKIEQQEVRWHVAQMLPRLELDARERATAVSTVLDYLDDESKIVKTFSMQALADFAEQDDRFRAQVIGLLEELTSAGSPAMKSRGRKLLARLASLGS